MLRRTRVLGISLASVLAIALLTPSSVAQAAAPAPFYDGEVTASVNNNVSSPCVFAGGQTYESDSKRVEAPSGSGTAAAAKQSMARQSDSDLATAHGRTNTVSTVTTSGGYFAGLTLTTTGELKVTNSGPTLCNPRSSMRGSSYLGVYLPTAGTLTLRGAVPGVVGGSELILGHFPNSDFVWDEQFWATGLAVAPGGREAGVDLGPRRLLHARGQQHW